MYKDFVIRNDDEIYIPATGFRMKNPKICELSGYDTLIDITKADYTYRLTFSDNDFRFRTLVSKLTKDRGYICI